VWYAKVGNLKDAIFYAKELLEKFPNSKYSLTARKNFELYAFEYDNEDINITMARYDKVLSSASDTRTLDSALYKKIKLFFKQKMYQDVLRYQDRLKALPDSIAEDKQEIIYDSAKAYTKDLLDDKNCKQALSVYDEYSIKLDSSMDGVLYDCYVSLLRYADAELVVERSRKINPLKDRIAWIDRAKELAKKDSEFKKVILLSDDILELSKALDINKYDYVVYDKFYAYLKLGNSSAAFVLAKRIEDVFSGDKRNISVFKKVVLEYQKLDEKDEFINYAQKIIVLQDKIGIHEESPWIEFVLMDKYIETKRFDEALSLSFKLGKEKLTELQKVQMFYIRSTIYQAQKNTIRQRKILEKCVKIDVKSKWATLCSKTLSIIK
jgi:hypothetical protein